jgi:hypothetical protein
MDNAVDEDWRVLCSLFPDGWGEQAKLSGAMSRGRGITSPELLLRLFLLHVGRGYSLRETAVRAKQAKLSEISDVGLLKRLRRSEAWLRWLCVQLLVENGVKLAGSAVGQRRIRIVDATIVKEPGPTGSQWRILYSLRLPELECDFFELTSTVGAGNGESFSRVPVSRQDLLLADAGYSKAPGIQSLVGQGADVVVRVNPHSLPLVDENGVPLKLLDKLRTLQTAGQVGEWKAMPAGTRVSGRICAVRKSADAVRRAHRRIERRASQRQTRTKPETREYAQYVVVFTTELSSPTRVILEWYRVRWQIELAFKRLKSLAELGHLPKHDARSSRAWLYGKLFVALLTQKLIRIGRTISPWGCLLSTPTQE